ncbi:bifunctional diguanylate cyclase/phosphodiesterase [Leptolyngbya ohadii]|uniref:bifunctional diguanylate cyclase/phosphodiesterase n=1 Tax=Leptolyngbya ohadii TaxID=1962290 RepID=UPI000B59C806|nr:EAL domain-containing protein [Leptolyngbya ohadii]
MSPVSAPRQPPRRRSRHLSLRLTLIVPFIIQIAVAVSLIGYLSFKNTQHTVNNLSAQILDRTDRLVAQHLDCFLSTAQGINQEITNVLEMQLLDRDDLTTIGRLLWQQAKIHPEVGYLNYGLVTGEYVGAGHYPNALSISETSARTQWKNVDYSTDAQGQRTQMFRVSDYNYREEAWYENAIRLQRAVWTPVYLWDDPTSGQEISLAAASPLYNANRELVGAIGVDLKLTRIQQYLQTLDISPSGKIFIVERDGTMIASSGDQMPFVEINGQAQRLNVEQSRDPAVQQTAQFLQQKFGSFAAIQQPQTLQIHRHDIPFAGLQTDRQFVHVMPQRDRFGLDWLVVITVPESDFMEQVHENARLTLILCLGTLALTIAIGTITARHLTQPILRTIHAADALSQNNWQQPIPDSPTRELTQLSRAFNRMATQIRQSFEQLAFIAHHDALTGLLNRRAFEQELGAAIAKRQYHPSYQFAVLFLDLDYFKLVNDSYGHLVGDQLLIAVRRRLQSCVRETDAIARFGGDEFTILLDGIASPDAATEIAQRIIHTLQACFSIEGREIFINTSVGIVFSSLTGDNTTEILRDADTALYQAKASGKGNYVVFNCTMHTQTVERLQLETDLRRALDRQEFIVYYQPIFDIITGQMTGFEALVRWQHPQRGLITPDKFIPLAEETGLIAALGEWVMQQACQQMRLWQEEFQLELSLTMSVNISTQQILHANFVSQLQQVLQETQLNPQVLKLEITESSVLSHEDMTRIRFEQLKNLGVQVSIDDFGTGYSSLSYLHRLPVHTLKIDRSFVNRLGAHGENSEIVEAIVMLAHRLGIEVVAEGVETTEQMEQLRVIRCTQAQGYLFSPPRSASDITTQLIAQKSARTP